MSRPSSPDLTFSSQLVRSLPQVNVVNGVWPANLEDSSQSIVCTFLMEVVVVLHVSAQYSGMDFTLGLNRRIFVSNDNTLEL